MATAITAASASSAAYSATTSTTASGSGFTGTVRVSTATKVHEYLATSHKHKHKSWTLNSFDIGKSLGKGKFGNVYLVRTKEEPHYIFAIKALYKAELEHDQVQGQLRREVEIQQNLRHPNVLRLFGWFSDKRRVFLMLEFAGNGELYKHLRKAGHFPEPRAAKYVAQVSAALAYLHTKHIMHRDLKPENILLDVNDEVKLADFGWSVHAPGNLRKTFCGTLDYLPPEMVNGMPYNNKVDNWTVGVLTYELVNGYPPFEDQEGGSKGTQRRIASLQMTIPSHNSREVKHLIKQLLRIRADERFPLDRVFEHPWVVKHYQPDIRFV
ncbi:kinase-like protein [Auriculariales sp. MPI-PUGE-AT-0066]|nr:kinase-like protein [Auriculariales sp. MPI-PUGE-AT-0066]